MTHVWSSLKSNSILYAPSVDGHKPVLHGVELVVLARPEADPEYFEEPERVHGRRQRATAMDRRCRDHARL